jgi:hypothetical protein
VRRLLFPGLAVVAAVAASASFADTTTIRDARNTRANKFDIRFATAGHLGRALYHSIGTYEPWRSGELESTKREPKMICLYIWRWWSNPKGRQDYEICPRLNDGPRRHDARLAAFVYHTHPRRKTGVAHVRRLSRHSIAVWFSKKAIGNPLIYRWQAVTGYTGKGCRLQPPFRFGCDDSAPTRDRAIHRLSSRAPVEPQSGSTGPTVP